MHQIQFRLGLRPRPHWGSLQCSPDPLTGLKGPTSKGRKGREGKGGDGDGEGHGIGAREGKGGEGMGDICICICICICRITLVRKINLLGITPTNCNQSGPDLLQAHRSRDDNGQEILGAIGQEGQNMGFG